MRHYSCPDCSQMVFFDDIVCTRSDTPLVFLPAADEVVSAGPDGPALCGNRDLIGCSFAAEEGQALCISCGLTRLRPPADDLDATASWESAEAAKRILVAQCLRAGIDIWGVTFDLPSSSHEPVITGHEDGVITIDVNEADDVVRTRMRERMGEAYRTMVGHFRHEIGHYLWATMVDGTDGIEGFREVFGDERADYSEALEAHYESSTSADWQENHVSEYASAHPWEDFAETVAHYLHIRDTIDTAENFGVRIDGSHPALQPPKGALTSADSIDDLIARWLPLSFGLNALNRSMGARPAYPFVIPPEVISKLSWVHDLFRAEAQAPAAGAGDSAGQVQDGSGQGQNSSEQPVLSQQQGSSRKPLKRLWSR